MFRVFVCLCVGMQLYHYTIGENVSCVSVSVWVALARDLSTQQIYSIHIFVFLLLFWIPVVFCYHRVFAGVRQDGSKRIFLLSIFYLFETLRPFLRNSGRPAGGGGKQDPGKTNRYILRSFI